MLLLIGAFTIGLILSLLALGVFISFRIFDFPDITADGSITLGAAVTAVLILAGYIRWPRWRQLSRPASPRERQRASFTPDSKSTACCPASWS